MTFSHYIIQPENGSYNAASRVDILQTNDSNAIRWVARYPFNATRNMQYTLYIPAWAKPDATNNLVKIYCKCNNVNSGTVKFLSTWNQYTISQGTGVSESTSNATVVGSGTIAGSGLITEILMPTLGGANYLAVDKNGFFLFNLTRDNTPPSNAQDNVDILNLVFSFVSDPVITKAGFWIPANAWMIPTAGIATSKLLNGLSGDGALSHVMLTKSGTTDSWTDFKFTVPPNYNGNLAFKSIFHTQASDTGTHTIRFFVGNATLGSSGSYTVTPISTGSIGGVALKFEELDCTPSTITFRPGDEVMVRIVRVGAAGTASLDLGFMGMWTQYDMKYRTPQVIHFMPNHMSTPTSGSAFIDFIDNYPDERFVARYAANVINTSYFKAYLPTIYRDQGRFRVRWRSNSTSSTGYQFRISEANPLLGATYDPVLTGGSVITPISSGLGVINEFTDDSFYVSLTSPGNINIKLDKLAGEEVEILEVMFEFRPNDSG